MVARLLKIKLPLLTAFVLLSLLLPVSPVAAEPNGMINYQGKLTTSSGVAVADGTYNMRFWLLQSTSQATTSAVWTESLTSTDKVQITNGLFSVMLGSTSPLTSVDFNQTLYLGVEIGGTSTSPIWDGEMSPRKPLGTVPAAFESFKLGGVASSSFLRSDQADTASSLITFTSGLLSSASSTIVGLSFDTATGTRLVLGSDTITDFTGAGLSLSSGALSVSSSSLNLDLEGLTDVTAMTETLGDLLYWNGSAWADLATSALKVSIGDTTGTLAATRGGTGLSTVTQNQLLIGGAGDTWTQVATSSLGLGNGTFLGLSDTPSSYTTNAIPYVSGSALAFDSEFVYDGTNLGLGTASPGAMLDIFGTSNGLRLSYDGSNYSEFSVDSSGLLTINSTGGTGSGYTLGSGLAEDAFMILDGNAIDYHIGLDDTDDLFKIGTGSTVGSSTLFQISSATTTLNTAAVINGTLTATGTVTLTTLTGGLLTTNSAGVLSTTTVASSSLAASNWSNNRLLVASTTATGGFDWVSTTTLGITTTDDNLTNNSIEDLQDVAAMTEATGDLLSWNGSAWTNAATSSLGLGNGTFLGLSDTQNAYTANRIMYTNSGATALTDSASFVFDGTSLGIGTTSPFAKLSIQGTYGSQQNLFSIASTTNAGGSATTSLFTVLANGNVGIGTTSPSAKLSVAGNTWLDSNIISLASSSASALLLQYFTEATSTIKNNSAFAFTIATSTSASPIFRIDTSGTYPNTFVDGSFSVNNGAIAYDAASDQTTIQNLALGNMTFGDDAGIVTWTDMGITTSAATGTVMSYSANLDNNPLLTIYGEANGSGGLQNSAVGIGTTTPWARLAVAGDATDSTKPLFTVASSTGSSLFHITYDGKVGIGTTSPSAKLSVAGDTYIGGALTATGTVTLTSLTGGLLTTNSAGLLSTTTVASSSLAAGNWSNGRLLVASTTATGGFDWVATTTLGISDDLTNNSIEDLSDVAAMTEATGDLLSWNGSAWTNTPTSSLGLGNGTFLGLSDTQNAFTANRIMYTNSGATALTDSAGFVFDGANLGIGTTTPSSRLTIQGAAGNANTLTIASSTGSTTLAMLADGNLELPGQLISEGIAWTARTSTTTNNWLSVTYGNGLFVAVSSNSAGTVNDRVMTSPDGINWTARTAVANNYWTSVTYGNGLFVAVSDNSAGTINNRVMTSPDGINWTARAAATNNNWRSITYGNGLFVAVSTNGTINDRVMTSPDGINWTARTAAANNNWISITYGNGLFVAVAWFGGTINDKVMTSPDGINWTARTAAANNQWYSVTYGNGLFVAVSYSGIGTINDSVMTSPDGITWTARTAAANNNWISITYGNGLFVAVSDNATGTVMDRVQTSPNGITWTARTASANNNWESIIYGNGAFVAVASTGSVNDRVMTSGKTFTSALAHNNIYQGGTSFMGGLRIGTTSTSVTSSVFLQGEAGINPFTVASSTGTALFSILQNGNVGIGTSSPYAKLSVTGTTDSQYLFAFASSTGSNLLTLRADGRLMFGNTATANILLNGGASTTNPLVGTSNVAIGNKAFSYYAAGAQYNIALGEQALYGSSGAISGDYNFAAGYQALMKNTTGSYNNAFGLSALSNNTSGNSNNALGWLALQFNSIGLYNNALGSSALRDNTTGSYNNAFGYHAFQSNTTGSSNNALGWSALFSNKNGSHNTGIGYYAGALLGGTATSSYNTYIGYQSGYNQTQGDHNLVMGTNAGYNLSTATSTTLLGAYTDVSSGTGISSSTAIGAGAFLTRSNTMVLGGTGLSAVDIVTGTSTPFAKLSIQGTYGSQQNLFSIASTTNAGGSATSSLFTVLATGNVGIGTSSPYAKLSVTGSGDTDLFNFASSTNEKLLSLNSRGILVFGTSTNASIFINGGGTTTQPYLSLRNIAIGTDAFSFTTAGSATDNIALGYQSLYGSSTVPMTGRGNFAGGAQVLKNNTTGSYNTALGFQSLFYNTTGSDNNALGLATLAYNNTGSGNNAFGPRALFSNTTGSYNNAFGTSTLTANTSGALNNAIGYYSLGSNTTGNGNNALGVYSLGSNTTGFTNNAVGYNALFSNTSGSFNDAFGYRAGYSMTTGSSTLFLGAYTNTLDGTISSSTALGAGAFLTRSNTMVLGGTGLDAVDIVTGTSTPFAKLSIQGTYGSQQNLFSIASTTNAGGSATSSLFTVLASGNVGIGSSTPYAKLSVTGSLALTGALYDRTASAGTNGMVLQTTGTGVQWIATSSLGLGDGTFLGLSDTPSSYTANAIPYVSGSALAFDSEFVYDGTNLGLGTASPGAMLDIFGTSNGLRLSYDGSNYSQLSVDSSGDLTITSTGGTGSVVTLGSGLAEDLALLLDGNSTDWYAGLDDTDDLFKIGTGGTVGSSTLFQISSATTTFNTALYASTTSASPTLTVIQSGTGDIINLFDGATEVFSVLDGGNVGIGTTSPSAKLSLQTTGYSGAGVLGLNQYLQTTNSVASAIQFGDYFFLQASNTATTTLVGSMFRLADDTTYGNTVRGLEVQTNRGGNTQGENTALSGFARTFGVRGFTSGDAGAVYEPAGGYFETGGTTQGNAMRGYSDTITTATLLSLFQASSTFAGTGLEMNFGNTTGSFSSTTSKFIDFQNAGTSVFTVTAFGTTTIGNGTTNNMASLQVGNGGICVDNDGTCTATSSGWVVADGFATGNSDLAEMYFSDTALEAGEIVVMTGELSIERATTDSALPILGVVSTNPGLTIGSDDTSLRDGETAYPIALAGRVPVKLSTENGPIMRGDELMLSSVPGVAMKATGIGAVVGIALEDFDADRRYSDTYLNQFGDTLVEPNYEPIFTNFDLRIHDGCYYSGGGAVGEAPCVPLTATTSDGQVAEANALAEQESIKEQLAVLHEAKSETKTLESGAVVQVGQIVMFVEKSHRWLDASQTAALGILTSTSSVAVVGSNENETLFDRLAALANRFVDGVLSVLTLKADRVETSELCVDGVCVDAAMLQELLNNASNQPTPPPSSEEVVVPEPAPDATSSTGGGGDSTDSAPPPDPEPTAVEDSPNEAPIEPTPEPNEQPPIEITTPEPTEDNPVL